MVQKTKRIRQLLTMSLALVACLAVRERESYAQESNIIDILVTDSRTLSNITVTFEAWDNLTNKYYSDWEAVSGDMPGTSSSNKFLSWLRLSDLTSGDALHELGYVSWGTSSAILIRPDPNFAPQFVSGRVTVRATIAGACHEDYEEFATWQGDMVLQFDGNQGWWDGSCWRGNFLKTYP